MVRMFRVRRNAVDRVQLPVRTVIVLLTLSLGAAGWHRLAPPARADEPRTPTLKEIGDKIKAQWDRIDSLLVDHEMNVEVIASPEIIKMYSLLESSDGMQETYAFKGKKRYYRYFRSPIVNFLAPGVDHDYDVIPGGKQIKKGLDEQRAAFKAPPTSPSDKNSSPVATKAEPFEVGFDGTEFHQMEPGGTTMVLDPTTMSGFHRNFRQRYLNNLDRVLPDPLGSPDDIKRHCFPEVPLAAGVVVRPALEVFDGARCVVVEIPGRDRIWFDTARNFGVRKHETLDADSGIVIERRVNSEFIKQSQGIWLPKRFFIEYCGPPLAPEAYRGKPLYRRSYLVRRISVNDVPDSLFTLSIPPGQQVFDATRSPRKDGKTDYLIYRMPADASQLDETVRNAQAEEEERLSQARRKSYFWYAVFAINIAIIAIVAVMFARKRGIHGKENRR